MGRAQRWTLAGAILLAALGAAGIVADAAPEGAAPQHAVPLAALATAVLLTGVALAGVVAGGDPQPLRRLGLGPGRLRTGSCLAAVVGTLALSFAVDLALRELALRDRGTLAELDQAVRGARGPALIVVALTLAVAPAFAEELLFRGLLQRGLALRWGARVAIPVAALAFAAVHADWIHAAAALPLGLYLGAVAHLADGIRAAVLCHAANNLAAVGAAAWGTSVWSGSPAAGLAALAVAGLCLVLAARWRRPAAPGSVRRHQAAGEGVAQAEEDREQEQP